MNLLRIRQVLQLVFGKRIGMFERYTENARRTVFFAKVEASECGSIAIEPTHIVMALFKDPWLAKEFLQSMPQEELRSQILTRSAPATKTEGPVDQPLSNESKRVLAYAAEEAETLLDPHIGNEHLLLGILREKRSVVATVLRKNGIDLEKIRARVKQFPREARRSKSGEQTERWRAAGIPDGYAWPKLFYNAAAETVIVELQAPGNEFHRPRRLFMRHKNSEVYEPIGNPAEDISYESLVTCESQPVILFNSMTYTRTGSGNWVGIYLFDLVKRELSLCLSKENFVAPAPYAGGWVSKLLGLSNDGHHAHAVAGLEMLHEGGMDMHYYLARMRLADRELELISRLKNTFF